MARIKHTTAESNHGSKKAPSKKGALKTSDGVRKPRRKHPGTKTMQEMRRLQKSTKFIFPQLAFRRLVREIAQDYHPELSFQPNAIRAAQALTEAYMHENLCKMSRVALHAGRITLHPKDISMINDICGNS